jgi:DNA polymerase (family 10)
MLTTHDSAAHLEQIAALMQLDKANSFKIKAFKEAAQNLGKQTFESIEVDSMPGVGESIRVVLKEFLTTGVSSRFSDLASRWPAGALSMLRVAGVGPATMLKLHKEGYADYEALLQAAKAGKLKAKLAESVLAAEKFARVEHRTAKLLAEWVVGQIAPFVQRVQICGSIRRKSPNSKDVDIIAQVPGGANKATIFSELAKLGEPINAGDVRSSIRVTRYGVTLQVDLWLVQERCWGSATLYATGSKNFNIRCRQAAIERGWKLNEYGLWDGDVCLESTEQAILQKLGVPWTEPEDRT